MREKEHYFIELERKIIDKMYNQAKPRLTVLERAYLQRTGLREYLTDSSDRTRSDLREFHRDLIENSNRTRSALREMIDFSYQSRSRPLTFKLKEYDTINLKRITDDVKSKMRKALEKSLCESNLEKSLDIIAAYSFIHNDDIDYIQKIIKDYNLSDQMVRDYISSRQTMNRILSKPIICFLE